MAESEEDRDAEMALARRLAGAMGAELVWRERPRRLEILGFPGPCWSRPGNVLRWTDEDGAGLLDVGTLWLWRLGSPPPGLSERPPAGLSRSSSDEEVDLVLSAMGF